MKLSLIATILVSPVLVLSTSSGFAEETLDRYTYNGDASYRKAGTNETLPSESPNSGNSAGFLETKDGYKIFDDSNANQFMWSLRGSHASRFSNGFNMQLDGKYHFKSSDYIENSEFGGTLHLAYTQPESYALGIFGNVGFIDTNLAGRAVVRSGFGAESAVFLQDATLYGRVGYEYATVHNREAESIFLQGGMRYFATDNIRLDLDARYQEELTQLTAAGNYRLQSQPVSLFAGYTYENNNEDFFGNEESSLIFAGLRFHFDSDTLRSEERNGLIWSAVN